MDEGVTITGSGVFPIAFVGDVVGVEPQSYLALFASWRVARAQVEEVVAGYAHQIVPCGLFAAGVTPPGHEV